jgi:hypothetical protein
MSGSATRARSRHKLAISLGREFGPRVDRDRFRGRGSVVYNVAFFFHVLGVLLFVAGIAVAEAALRRQRPAEVALLLGLTRVGVLLVAVGGVLAGVFGLWLVHLGHWR